MIGDRSGPVRVLYHALVSKKAADTAAKRNAKAPKPQQTATAQQQGERTAGTLSDDELLDKARAARNGQEFSTLFDRGGLSGFDDDESRADLALCSRLAFWTGPDPARIERLFNRSALGQRDKWRDRLDDRERTIKAALDSQTEFYKPVGARPALGRDGHEAGRAERPALGRAGCQHHHCAYRRGGRLARGTAPGAPRVAPRPRAPA